MSEIPRPVALRIIYWSVVTAVLLAALGVAASVRRQHAFDAEILQAAQAHQVHPALISSIIWKESRFNPSALGKAREIGLMQVTDGAAQDWARAHNVADFDPERLWDPEINIGVGTWYLARALRHWEQQTTADPLPVALAEYNAGRTRASQWTAAEPADTEAFVAAITIASTRDYVEDILARFHRGR
jgi:soluble lytic murein transglycosylase